MKIIFSFLFFLIMSTNIFASTLLHGNMGILTDGVVNVKNKDYAIVFHILLNRIILEENMMGNVLYYDEAKEIIDDFLTYKVDYILLNPYYYLKNQKKLNSNIAFYWSVRKYTEKFQKMLILVKKDSNINNIGDLKDKTIMLQSANQMGKVLLDKLVLEKEHISSKNYVKDIQELTYHSTAILKTFFGKTDATIVPKYAYDLVCEMNPSVKKLLKIIYETKPIFTPILCLIHKKTSTAMIQRMQKVSKKFHTTVDGKNILALFKMKQLDVITIKELDPLINFYKEYESLYKKYINSHVQNR